MKYWTEKEKNKLIQLYANTSNKTLSKLFKRSFKGIVGMAFKLNLVKSSEYRIKVGKRTGFKKGSMPTNKGKAWAEFMSKEGQRNSLKTTFKKGQQPLTAYPKGTIIFRKAHRGIQYNWIKVGRKMKPLHIHLWEQKKGKVPKGRIIIFKNGNTSDTRLSNLKCITRAENMKRNTIHNLPPELKEINYLKIKINNQIKRIQNGKTRK